MAEKLDVYLKETELVQLCLVDASGVLIGVQERVVIDQSADDISRVTVTFLLDSSDQAYKAK